MSRVPAWRSASPFANKAQTAAAVSGRFLAKSANARSRLEGVFDCCAEMYSPHTLPNDFVRKWSTVAQTRKMRRALPTAIPI